MSGDQDDAATKRVLVSKFRTTRTFALEPGGLDRIEVSWDPGVKRGRVCFDGKRVATFANAKALASGIKVATPDGATLEVRSSPGGLDGPLRISTSSSSGLRVLFNGKPVAPGIEHYEGRLTWAFRLVLVIGAFNLVLGLIAATTGSLLLRDMGLEVPAIVLGAIFVGLAVFVRRERSRFALGAAIAIYAADAVVALFTNPPQSPGQYLKLFGVKVFCLWYFVRAFQAIGVLEKHARLATPPQSVSRSEE